MNTDLNLDDVFSEQKVPDGRPELRKNSETAKQPRSIVDDSTQEMTLDDFFYDSVNRRTSMIIKSEVDEIKQSQKQFEKNLHERKNIEAVLQAKEGDAPESSEDVDLPPSKFDVEEVFNTAPRKEEKKENDEISQEVDLINQRASEFKHNLSERKLVKEHNKVVEEEKKEESVVDIDLPASDLKLEDILRSEVVKDDSGDEIKKEIQIIKQASESFKESLHEREQLVARKAAEKEEVAKSDLKPSKIDVEEVFEELKEAKSGHWKSHFPKQSEEEPKDQQEQKEELPPSEISLDDIFSKKETAAGVIPTETPPNSDSEIENRSPDESFEDHTKSDKVTVNVNLDEVFGSPPATVLSNSSTPETRFKNHQKANSEVVSAEPSEDWLKGLGAEAKSEPSSKFGAEFQPNSTSKNESESMPNSDSIFEEESVSQLDSNIKREDRPTSTPNLGDDSKPNSTPNLGHPSPSIASSQVRYEWVAELVGSAKEDVKEDSEQVQIEELDEIESVPVHSKKDDSTWVSSIVYRPSPPENRRNFAISKSARTSRIEDSEEPTSSDVSWVKQRIEEISEYKQEDVELSYPSTSRASEETKEDDRLLDDIIIRIGARKLSGDELEQLRRDWKQRREAFRRRQVEKKRVSTSGDIPLDQVFKPSEANLDVDVATTSSASVAANRPAPTETVTSSPLHVTTSELEEDLPRTPKTSPTGRRSEQVTKTHTWKSMSSPRTSQEAEKMAPSEISLDEIFTPPRSLTSDHGATISRKLAKIYEKQREQQGEPGRRPSNPTGSLNMKKRHSTTPEVKIDLEDVFRTRKEETKVSQEGEKSKEHDLHEKSSFDDYYLSTVDDFFNEKINYKENDTQTRKVSEFVDDLFGKSFDEATNVFRSKKNQKKSYDSRTDTSIDRKTTPSADSEDIMRLIFSKPADPPKDSETETRNEYHRTKVVDIRDATSTSSTSNSSKPANRPQDEEILEIEVQNDYFYIRGSYALLIPKSDPLGQLLQKLHDESDSLASLDFTLAPKLKKLLLSCLQEKALHRKSTDDPISWRGRNLTASVDHASATFLEMNANKYHPTENPQGIVNFCTAVNNICAPLLTERFKNRDLYVPEPEHLLNYPPMGGYSSTKEALSKYFAEHFGADVPSSELVLTPATKTGYDVLSYSLFEAGDIILTNGPAYAGTISNCEERAQCHVEVVETNLEKPTLDISAFEKALKYHHDRDNMVKGIVIINPHNPLGVVFDQDQVIRLCNWAASQNLYVIIDEIFANSVFDPKANFKSFLCYYKKLARPDHVAYMWGFSKDYGVPGFKFAVIHSTSPTLRAVLGKLEYYSPVSCLVQDFAVKFLADNEWLQNYHKTLKHRLAVHYNFTVKHFKEMRIPYVPAQGGFCVFADFSEMLKSKTSKAELELWRKVATGGVMLTPGDHQKCLKPGWFRLVFACTKEELQEGIRRLYKLTRNIDNPNIEPIRY